MFKKIGARSVEEITHLVDCRPYAKFLNTTSSESATVFMKASDHDSIPAQINTIHRCRHYFVHNTFKAVTHTVVSQQFTRAVFALQEEEKFLKFTEKERWPTEMRTSKKKLLRTTELDEDIDENQSSDDKILKLLSIHSFDITPSKRAQSLIHSQRQNYFKHQIFPPLTSFVQMGIERLQIHMLLTSFSLVLKRYMNMNAKKKIVVLQQ